MLFLKTPQTISPAAPERHAHTVFAVHLPVGLPTVTDLGGNVKNVVKVTLVRGAVNSLIL